MFTTFISVALFSTLAIQGARAQFAIDTPALTQCQPTTVTWSGTNAEPYNLIVVPSDDVCGDELADLGDFNGTSATWTVNIPAGQAVTFSLQDALGEEAWSGSITVQGSNDTSCLNSTLTSSSAIASSAAASSAVASSLVGTPASGTTLVVGPQSSASGVVNYAPPAAASSSGAVAVGAANTGDNPTSAGFSMHQLSAPIMVASLLAAIVLSL